ncbi:MAG: AmmeMemoRadiSam system radical SAM enzyme [Spirochaetia bacterium]|nr:AmmeMemoRadiSam system radical SAM enzyme [Spirochaetia bacterium]
MKAVKEAGFKAKYWHTEDDKIVCDLCPRECKLKEGKRGLCFVRKNENNEMILTTYGRSSGFCIDPIEKKPLYHFYPQTPILSFGTAGCNMFCKFCQNWDISKSTEMDTLCDSASPEVIARAAKDLNCKSVAFTYNDPVIFLEYAKDTAKECHTREIKTVAVTAGYINREPAKELFSFIDAVNVDLKGFSEDFYHNLCSAKLQPVLDTLKYIKNETRAWLEITNLVIPAKNDSEEDIDNMTSWIAENLGYDVPLHFTAFHPDYKMIDLPSTSIEALKKAQRIAQKNGLHYVYTGNIHDKDGESTYCPSCAKKLIGRDWYEMTEYNLNEKGECQFCLQKIAGYFDKKPGNWGSRRTPVRLSDFH